MEGGYNTDAGNPEDGGELDGIETAQIDWSPCKLDVGDRVGVLVTSSGKPWVFENGRCVAQGATQIPLAGPLYVVVDLLGSCQGVELIPDAVPPQYFDPRILTPTTKVAEGYLSARHEANEEEELGGVVFCGSPIAWFNEGAYFEVRVDEVLDDQEDGLVIGVCLTPPDLSKDPPKVADGVLNSWSIGYDGSSNVCGSIMTDAVMTPDVGWYSAKLKVGDRVGLFINRAGKAWVIENGDVKAQIPDVIPTKQELYPLIDLLGNTVKVTIIPDASPPAGVPVHDAGEAADGSEGPGNSKGAGSKKSLLKKHKTMNGFDKKLASKFVTLSPDCLSATHNDASAEHFYGVLLGDAPLKRFANGGCYYEIEITKIREKTEVTLEDGLAIGITTTPPHVIPASRNGELPTVADTVPGSVTFGYDGVCTIVDPLPEEAKEVGGQVCRFRSRHSEYRVSKFNRSVYGELNPSKGKHDKDK